MVLLEAREYSGSGSGEHRMRRMWGTLARVVPILRREAPLLEIGPRSDGRPQSAVIVRELRRPPKEVLGLMKTR